MEIKIETTSDGSLRDEITSLENFLITTEELRGRVQLIEAPPEEGKLGSAPELITVALINGTAIVLASALVSWVRYRTSDVKVRIVKKGSGTSIELTSHRVRSLEQNDVGELIEQTRRALEESEEQGPGRSESEEQ